MMNGRRITGAILIGIGVLILALKLGRIYDPAPALQKWGDKSAPTVSRTIKNIGPAMTDYAICIGFPVLIGALLLAGGKRPASTEAPAIPVDEGASESHVIAQNIAKSAQKNGERPVQACTVLQASSYPRQVWQFQSRSGGFVLDKQQTAPQGQPLPSSMLAKPWTSLWQKKINAAWLPAEKIFLRVIQIPKADFAETVSMVELQLERLSPMPVAQVVWAIHVLPNSTPGMQTVVVIIAARDAVEQFLAQLEGEGYFADELELPVVDQLQATPVRNDGVYVYPDALGAKNVGLAAWWYGGVLHNLDLITLPGQGASSALREQVTQMAWAGEMDGWLTAPPAVHLVASGENLVVWEPPLREGLETPVDVIEPLAPAQLAAATARRIARRSGAVNLLPPEYAERYQQQFVDRLWMRGLLAVCGVYLVGVAIYMVALGAASYRTSSIETQVAGLSHSYTNALQVRAQYSVLKDREDLKYAGLDCWKAVAEHLPAALTLDSFNFSGGKRLTLRGTAPADQVQQTLDFERIMRRATIGNGDPLFDLSKTENLIVNQRGNIYSWEWNLELKRSEAL
jgi:hypothetical protein